MTEYDSDARWPGSVFRRSRKVPGSLCSSGKEGFGTLDKADTRLRMIRAQPKTSYSPRRSYRCPECGAWHLTHLTLSQLRARLRACPAGMSPEARCADCGEEFQGRKGFEMSDGRHICSRCWARPRPAPPPAVSAPVDRH